MRSRQKSQGTASGVGHHPFRDLSQLVKKAGLHLESVLETTPCSASQPEPEPVADDANDQEVFERAMRGVAPLSWPGITESPTPSPSVARANPQLADLRLMEDALEGRPAPAIDDHPEYIEGWIGVTGRLLLPYLRDGLYSIQGQVDLHGLGPDEARENVEAFIIQMSRFRSCCVKIIHGRGINSPKDTPVLKESLQRWLTTRRMARYVVAYASASPRDGGVGAVYVLLKRSLAARKARA